MSTTYNVVQMFDEHGMILLASGKMAFRPFVQMRHLTVKAFKTLKGAQAAADRINADWTPSPAGLPYTPCVPILEGVEPIKYVEPEQAPTFAPGDLVRYVGKQRWGFAGCGEFGTVVEAVSPGHYDVEFVTDLSDRPEARHVVGLNACAIEPREEPAAPIKSSTPITPQTHGIVTWSTNGGLQASGPMTVSEGTTFVLQELRPNGYRDAALRPLTDAEAAEFEASRLAFVATLEKHRKPVQDLDLTWIDEAGTERSYLESPGAVSDPEDVTSSPIWMEGYKAAQAGTKWWNNPKESGSAEAYQWDAGHTRFRTHGGLAA